MKNPTKWIILSVMLLAALMTMASAENETTNETTDEISVNETTDDGSVENDTVIDDDDSVENETVDDGDSVENETLDEDDGVEYNDTIENETIDEVDAFHTTLGSEIRLLQLESSITRNIMWGEEIVAAIKEKNSSADTSELESIIVELKVLQSEVASITPSAGEEAAQKFVDIKEEAIQLTQEFRKTVHSMLKISDVEGLRKRLHELKLNETKAKVAGIHELQREFNAQKVNEIFSAIGLTNPQLIEEIKSGEAKLKDIKAYLKNATSNMSAEEKKQAFFALKEQVSKRNIFLRAVADKVQYKRLDRLQDRMEDRLHKAEDLNVSANVTKKLEKHIGQIENRIERIENRTEWKIEKIVDITAKRVEHVEGLIRKVENRSNKITERLEERLEEGNLSDGQKNRVENRIEKVENKTTQVQEKLEDRIETIKNKSERLQDKVGNHGSGNGNGGEGQ
jgi:hypothetical protein